MGKNQHVEPSDGGWGVRGEGNSRLTRQFPTQSQAIDVTRQIAQNQQSELVVHNRQGQIRDKDSHGRDAYPPKG